MGWFQGRFEMGPRALGNRSILADPRDPQMQDRLAHIKRREPFRPLAPAELVEHAAEFFEIEQPDPFTTMAPRVREEKLQVIPAAIHVDGTAFSGGSLDDTMEWPKRCRLLLGTFLRVLTADRGSGRVGCEAYCRGQPGYLLLAPSREKPMSSSILRRRIGMLILPAADMSRLRRGRRSRLRRK